MVTGNFALLADIDPYEVHEWYLAVYADAYEWVELLNTLGMSLFGDGGLAWLQALCRERQLHQHCKGCSYDVKLRTGPKACPFNYLCWDFLMRNRQKLGCSQRLKQICRSVDAMSDAKKAEVKSLRRAVPQRAKIIPLAATKNCKSKRQQLRHDYNCNGYINGARLRAS